MPRRKTTIKVSEVKDTANAVLKNSDDEVKEYRTGIALFIEHILMDTGNYRGFGYITSASDNTVDPPVISDDTRRFYY